MHHRTVKNGQRNTIDIKYGALIMILLLKMASESNGDRAARSSESRFNTVDKSVSENRLSKIYVQV